MTFVLIARGNYQLNVQCRKYRSGLSEDDNLIS